MYTCIWIRDVCYWVLRYMMENSNTLPESYFTLQKKHIRIYIGIWAMTVPTRNDPNLYIYYNSIDTDVSFRSMIATVPLDLCSLAERKNMWLPKVYSKRGCSRGHDHMLVGFICYRLPSSAFLFHPMARCGRYKCFMIVFVNDFQQFVVFSF